MNPKVDDFGTPIWHDGEWYFIDTKRFRKDHPRSEIIKIKIELAWLELLDWYIRFVLFHIPKRYWRLFIPNLYKSAKIRENKQ